MSLGETYLEKLKEAHKERGLIKHWDHLMEIATGVTEEDEQRLIAEYPEFPKSLLEIMRRVDGTYWRMYGKEEVTHYFFGSDLDDYPYYLFSANQILEQKNVASNFADHFYYFLEEDSFEDSVDEKIQPSAEHLKWACFSDCMNNGGTSSLYIDFTPSDKGVNGQIIRYLHDPDELKVIANSFDEFLDMLIKSNLTFVNKDFFD